MVDWGRCSVYLYIHVLPDEYGFFSTPIHIDQFEKKSLGQNMNIWIYMYTPLAQLRGSSTLTWELLTGDCKITLEDKQKIGNLTYYISSESLRDAESE